MVQKMFENKFSLIRKIAENLTVKGLYVIYPLLICSMSILWNDLMYFFMSGLRIANLLILKGKKSLRFS